MDSIPIDILKHPLTDGPLSAASALPTVVLWHAFPKPLAMGILYVFYLAEKYHTSFAQPALGATGLLESAICMGS